MQTKLVLGIESTCDETACAIVQDGSTLLAHSISSQADLFAEWGGVLPELACRRHIDLISPLLQNSLESAQLSIQALDLIAVAIGPGLIGALLVGVNIAKGLSISTGIPWIGVNHVDAHLYAAMMGEAELCFPALGIVLSGGHTLFVNILDRATYHVIGTTVDDAIGEAFDKVARLLGLPYPGGAALEKLALSGDPIRYPFTAGRVKGKPWHFSFSGLKTSVLYTVRGPNSLPHTLLSEQAKADIAASFQRVAFSDIVKRALAAVDHFSLKAIYVGGGVSCNRALRNLFSQQGGTLPIFWPPDHLCTDNAIMIAGLGYHQFTKKGADPLSLLPYTQYPQTG